VKVRDFIKELIDFLCIGGVRSYFFSISFGFIFFILGLIGVLFITVWDSLYHLMDIYLVKLFVYFYLFFGKILSFVLGKGFANSYVNAYPMFLYSVSVIYILYLFLLVGLNFGNLLGWIMGRLFKRLFLKLKSRGKGKGG